MCLVLELTCQLQHSGKDGSLQSLPMMRYIVIEWRAGVWVTLVKAQKHLLATTLPEVL